MKPLRILATLLLPLGVALVYGPLHKGWLVQWFGCSCQGKRGFSASTLSFLVHGGAAAGSAILLFRTAAGMPLRQRINTLAFGLIFLGAVWLLAWQRDCSVG